MMWVNNIWRCWYCAPKAAGVCSTVKKNKNVPPDWLGLRAEFGLKSIDIGVGSGSQKFGSAEASPSRVEKRVWLHRNTPLPAWVRARRV